LTEWGRPSGRTSRTRTPRSKIPLGPSGSLSPHSLPRSLWPLSPLRTAPPAPLSLSHSFARGFVAHGTARHGMAGAVQTARSRGLATAHIHNQSPPPTHTHTRIHTHGLSRTRRYGKSSRRRWADSPNRGRVCVKGRTEEREAGPQKHKDVREHKPCTLATCVCLHGRRECACVPLGVCAAACA
jgi:hypothetical protein